MFSSIVMLYIKGNLSQTKSVDYSKFLFKVFFILVTTVLGSKEL